MYKLTCPDCKKAYVGQTERNFTTRYNEHKHAFRSNSHTSSFAHLSEHAHSLGTIKNTMQILHYHKKAAQLNTLERHYIHADYASNNHLNDSHTTFPNAIFDTLLKTHRPTPPPTTTTHHVPHAVNTPLLQHKALHLYGKQGRLKESGHTHTPNSAASTYA
jgi:hypothetical protein